MVAELSIPGGALARLARRGVAAAQDNFAQLRVEAEAYEQSGPEMSLGPEQVLPILLTGLLVLFIIASVRYTIGDVMATLAMIESPTTTEIIEPKAPPYYATAEEATEKEALMGEEKSSDVEITIIKHKPITAKITTTMGLLQRTGGFFSRWRGLPWSVFYHGLHSVSTHVLCSLFGFSWIANAVFFVLTSMMFVRLHAAWTHSMIAKKTATGTVSRLVARKDCARLLLPTVVFSAAQQATLLLPMGMAALLFRSDSAAGLAVKHGQACAGVYVYYAIGSLMVVLVGAGVAFAILLPAAITLTRIEATLVPTGFETIVPFDKDSIVGDLDLQTRLGRKRLFAQTWRSVDLSSRLRLVKVYLKMILVQFTVAIVGLHLIFAEVYIVGGEKLGLLIRSGYAQLRLAAAEAEGQIGQ